MNADAGARLPGWDGLVDAGPSRGYCPPGRSVWQLSLDNQMHERVHGDLARRFGNLRDRADEGTTYVAVTTERYPDKGAWMERAMAVGTWAEVRLYDADDLVSWLASAPAVVLWIVAELGQPAHDRLTIESLVRGWRERTHPPLPLELVLAGSARTEMAEKVRAWLAREQPGVLHVWGDTLEEARLFAAAAVELAPSPERERWRARTIAVESEAAWADIPLRDDAPLLLLPAFTPRAPERASKRALVMVPHEGQSPERLGHIHLEPNVPFATVAEILERAGFDRTTAERLARESEGKLLALQRLCGHVQPPSWARSIPRAPLVAMLLAGGFTPRDEADAELMRALGADPGEVERMCQALATGPDAAMVSESSWSRSLAYRWLARADVWRHFVASLTESDLRRFGDIVMPVLRGQRRCSDILCEGVADTLARLALADRALARLGSGRGSALAASVVRELLQPERDHWYAVVRFLPTLAEAAPETFLDAMDASSQLGEHGVSGLMKRFGSHLHVWVLRALEVLGWEADLMPRAALALATLAARDPGIEIANRPLASLVNMLHPVLPQTAAPMEQRVEVLERIVEREPEVGWKLLLHATLRAGWGVMIPNRRPGYREWPLPPPDRTATGQEFTDQQERARTLAAACAGTDGARWAELVSSARMVEELEKRYHEISDPERVLWTELRRIIARLNRVKDRAEELERAQRLYRHFEPDDEIERIAWLFAPDATLSGKGSDEEQFAELSEKRDAALETLWQHEDRWNRLTDLVQAADASMVASTLARMPFAETLEDEMLSPELPAGLRALVPTFVVVRSFHRDGMPTLEAWTRQLMEQERESEVVDILLRKQPARPVWDLLEELGQEVDDAYWRRVHGLYGEHEPEDWEYAVSRLLALERPVVALEHTWFRDTGIQPMTMVRILEALRDYGQELDHGEGRAHDYDLKEAFKYLERDPTIDTERIVALEMAFFPQLVEVFNPDQSLEDQIRPIRHLSHALASDPDYFVSLIVRANTRTETQEPQAEEARRASQILFQWPGYPGMDLPPEEREEHLRAWSRAVLEATHAAGHTYAGVHEVSRVLARVPAGPDGLWPCEAARELIESDTYEGLADAIHTARYNLRGATVRAMGAGGDQERELADVYQDAARQMRARWPRSAAMVRKLVSGYRREAEIFDANARTTRARHGMDVVDERETPTRPRAPGANEEQVPDASEQPVPPGDELPRLVSLGVRDFRCIENLELALEHETKHLSGLWTCLAGINGSGKTSVLQALCLCLLGPRRATEIGGALLQRMRRKRPDGTRCDAELTLRVRSGETLTDLSLVISDDGAHAREPGDSSAASRARDKLARHVLVSYGASRNLSWYNDRRHADKSPAVERQMTLFDPLAPVARAEAMLDAEHRDQRLDALLTALLIEVFERDIELVPNDRAMSFVVAGDRVDAVDLPDGFRSAMAWLVDLCATWCETWPQRANESPRDIRAIVLIDEIDLHLHPSLQRILIPRLRSAMPQVQWVVTTHSPFLLSSFERTELVLLERTTDDGVEGIQPLDRDILGFTMDQIYEWLMDTPPTSGAMEDELAHNANGADNAKDIGLWLEMSPDVDADAAQDRVAERKALLERLKGLRSTEH